MKALFVAGTDTGAGKTVVTGCLARYLSESGRNVITQKWIQTGCDSSLASDIRAHLKLMGRNINDVREYLPHLAPYVFRAAASPHFAAEKEDKVIDVNRIVKSFKFLSGRFDFVIVEGIGGTLVPFNRKRLVIDIVSDLDLPVLVVAGNRLGAINHTLLTVESLTSRKIKVLGIVFNNLERENRDILEDNPEIISELTGKRVFGVLPQQGKVLPQQGSYEKLYKKFVPIGKAISEAL